MLIPGTLTNIAYDRYMAPLVPLLILAVLMRANRGRTRVPCSRGFASRCFPAAQWLLRMTILRKLRADLKAAHLVKAAGIPRITFQAAGNTMAGRNSGLSAVFGGSNIPTNSHAPGAPRGCIESFDYVAWLHPYRRGIAMWKRDDLTAECCSHECFPNLIPVFEPAIIPRMSSKKSRKNWLSGYNFEKRIGKRMA